MEPLPQKLLARAALTLFVLVCGGWLAGLDYTQRISTNVLDLVPPADHAPELALVRSLADTLQARVMLFALRDPAARPPAAAAAARMFAHALARDPHFAEAVALPDESGQNEMGRLIYERRFELLLPSWLAEQERVFAAAGLPQPDYSAWLAEQTAARLEAYLSRPEAVAMQDLVLGDPLLLVPQLAEAASSLVAPGSDAGGEALVWARIKDSPLAEAGQAPIFAAVDQALASVRSAHPGTELRWTGVNRFAAASRARIESEIKTLNLLSVLAVLAISALFVRRLGQLLHLAPVIFCALLGAWTVATLVFPRLHILVFVIGSLLSGVAIDYGFYIFMQPALRPDESYESKLRRLLKPLLASCLTTVIGFSLLLFSDLPLIRQVGLFVSAGLLSALATAILYFAQLERPFLETRAFSHRPAGVISRRWRRVLRGAALALAALAASGLTRLHWKDDVRELDVPADALQANDQALRHLFGDRENRSLYLTYGGDIAAARAHLAEFLAYESRIEPRVEAASLGLVFPTAADFRALPARLGRIPHFSADLRTALARHGFLPESFAGFFNAWAALPLHPPAGTYDELYASVRRTLTGPLGQLFQARGSICWFLTLVDRPEGSPPPPALSTVSLSQLQQLNQLFAHYRWSALRLSLLGLALIIASVFVIYPFRLGLRIALIPAGSCFVVFGLLGLGGATLNLFNLLGAFLGVCLCHNYSIFSAGSAQLRAAPPASVRLSALCVAASFAVLAASHIPVVHALGLTVTLIVLTGLTAVELEPLLRSSPRS